MTGLNCPADRKGHPILELKGRPAEDIAEEEDHALGPDVGALAFDPWRVEELLHTFFHLSLSWLRVR